MSHETVFQRSSETRFLFSTLGITLESIPNVDACFNRFHYNKYAIHLTRKDVRYEQ